MYIYIYMYIYEYIDVHICIQTSSCEPAEYDDGGLKSLLQNIVSFSWALLQKRPMILDKSTINLSSKFRKL